SNRQRARGGADSDRSIINLGILQHLRQALASRDQHLPVAQPGRREVIPSLVQSASEGPCSRDWIVKLGVADRQIRLVSATAHKAFPIEKENCSMREALDGKRIG